MKRAADRDVNPNRWSGVGGKIERNEINDPYAACMREIGEETGMTAADIKCLTLRYIILRRYKNTIRQSYVYFGKTNKRTFIDTDEGSLHWISKAELGKQKYSATFTYMMRHYLSPMAEAESIFVGTAEYAEGKLKMCWAKIEDFEDIE